ncbi:AAA family ATPase [Corallococcus llansteffanensis]|uniref:ATP-binding protein n=1 Tax=Corallococcus llansteffanensis TaxID=2316731 RepID=A0A3A8PQP6_9BACT|nr:AAA family ATPase [Corallococcus llansteffanensis]RKH57400.1 ATP-binding protein [Corallococcus llansteffanensis]
MSIVRLHLSESDPMYVQSLSILNVRGFKSVAMKLRHPDEPREEDAAGTVLHLPNITLLLGNNGSGKTTVLRAVALSTLAPILTYGSGYVPYALVRRVRKHAARGSTATAMAILHEQDTKGKATLTALSVHLAAATGFTDRFLLRSKSSFRWTRKMYEEDSPAFFVLGYGATRRVETGPVGTELRAKERLLRYQRVAGLFEEHITLVPLSSWLPGWQYKHRSHHREVFELINQLLPDAELLKKSSTDGEYLFRRGGATLPYPALSDGYRAFISWVGDLLYHLCLSCPPEMKLVDCKGIVLVDEVDLHLHPEWQRHIVPRLSQAFPNLQFILTSHSPLVAGTLSSRNVLLLEELTLPSGERLTAVRPPEDELYGLSSDQILTSDSFKLESTRDEQFFERLKAAADDAREGGVNEALRFMRMVGGGAAAETPLALNKKKRASPPPRRKPATTRVGEGLRAVAKPKNVKRVSAPRKRGGRSR